MSHPPEVFYADGSELRSDEQDISAKVFIDPTVAWRDKLVPPPRLFDHRRRRSTTPEPVNHRLGDGSRTWKPLARFQDNKFATIDICHDDEEESGQVFVKLAYKKYEALLSQERRILHTLNKYAKMRGIPRVIYFQEISPLVNRFSRSDILVTSVHGESARAASAFFSPLPVIDIFIIGYSLISILRRMHRYNIVHGDIRPENIFLRREGHHLREVNLVNFGSAMTFLDIDGEHKTRRMVRRDILYDIEFCSRFTHRNLPPSRTCDLESLGYALVFLFKGTLPWTSLSSASLNGSKSRLQGPSSTNQEYKAWERIDRNVAKMKIKAVADPLDLCADLPVELSAVMRSYFGVINSANYLERPNYGIVADLFRIIVE